MAVPAPAPRVTEGDDAWGLTKAAVQVEGMKITVEDIIGSTGLELKVDPGVPWVYAGFAGVLLTAIMQQCFAHCPGSFQEWLCIHCMTCHARAV